MKRIFEGRRKDLYINTTEDGLRQQLEELNVHQLREYAQSELQGARDVNTVYNKDRTTGVRKRMHWAQEIGKAFSDFLASYSGIIELVRNAGQQYGEVAYETLSVLLIVRIAVLNS
jgi:hypothetical protein